jgi:ribose 5-phosphate isomerase RpiB
MALNKDVLKGLIVAKVTAAVGVTHLETTELDKFADAIADAVVTHIKAAAVTACGAGAGTVT